MAYAFRAATSAGNASGGALAINKPTGTASGDLLVAVLYLESDANTFSSVPSGWALAGSIANTGAFKMWVYWKVAGGSEPSTYSWTPASSAWRAYTMAAYSGGTSPAVDVAGVGGQGDGINPVTNQTAPSVTTTAANDLLIFAYGNFSGTNVTAVAGAATNLRVSLGGCTISDATIATASATGTTRPTAGPGSDDYAAIHIAFKLTGSGGTTFPLSVGGTLSPTGSLAKQDNKTLGGTLTGAGALMKQANKLLVGSLTSTGGLSKQPSKAMGGSLTSSGTLSNIKTALLSLAGTLTSSGSLTKQTNKSAAGTLTSSGGLRKQANKLLAGALTSSGVLSSIKTAILNLSGTLTSSGRLGNQPSKLFSGTLPSAGQLIKQVNKRMAGSLTSSGALTRLKTVVLSVGGTLTSSGGLRKQVNTSFSGTLAPSGGLIKQVRKFFAGVLSSMGSFIGIKSGGVVVLAGYDLADTESLPVFFDTVMMPVLADSITYTTAYDAEMLPLVSLVSTAPLVYDSEALQVYYDANKCLTFIDPVSIPVIYGR